MFSDRFHWDLEPNRLARLLRDKRRAARRKFARAAGKLPERAAQARRRPRRIQHLH